MRDIRDLRLDELVQAMESLGEKPFRARQVWDWLWKKPVASFGEMTNLSLATRDKLAGGFSFDTLSVAVEKQGKDKTVKVLFALPSGDHVEGVLIPDKDRVTACISTQVGCALRCGFCATGLYGFRKNLTVGEIFDQVVMLDALAHRYFDRKLSNVVVMGMGEPLNNYDQVMSALEKVTSPDGLGMSPSRVTLSTVGIVKGIRQLADDGVRFNLAISLHTADPAVRSRIMPVNLSNPLGELSEAIRYFHQQTGTRITYEYLMLEGVNDSLDDAARLAVFCRVSPCKINLIAYNGVSDSPFRLSSKEKIEAFRAFLESKNLIVNIRSSRGQDIDAACGQLANKLSPGKAK